MIEIRHNHAITASGSATRRRAGQQTTASDTVTTVPGAQTGSTGAAAPTATAVTKTTPLPRASAVWSGQPRVIGMPVTNPGNHFGYGFPVRPDGILTAAAVFPTDS